MEYFEVIKCGEIVKINDTEINAIILQVCLSFNKIEYQLGYMLNGSYITVWMPLNMFTVKTKVKKQSIGFNQK
jgi:hypothetical protein